jgi:RNA polymerase sigma factor (sigma-70 family)
MAAAGPERRLITDYLSEDRNAVQEIDRMIARALLPFRKRLQSHLDDIKQDVHISLLEIFRRDGFRFESSLKTYVGSVTAHRALSLIDFLRIRDHEPLEAIAEAYQDSASLTPEQAFARKEHWARIVAVIHMASRECCRIWRMVLREGLSYSEIAVREGKAEDTIKWRLFACREQANKNMERLQKCANLSPRAAPKST